MAGCGGGGGGKLPPLSGGGRSSGSPQPGDWNTFGDGLSRQGYNASEATLTSGNAGGLHQVWARNLGAAIDAQPLYAANVELGGSLHNVLYVGTEGGVFYAIDASSGNVLWQQSLGSTHSGCTDLPGGTFGITDTATFDRSTNRVYVADGLDKLHALDMTTGKEAGGWPVTITPEVSEEHVYSALIFNPANQLLYAQTAGYCDFAPYSGRLIAVNTGSATVAATFFPGGANSGGGLWGMGGPSIDTTSNDVFIATGNTESTTDHDANGEQVVRLTAMLAVEAANYPGLSSGTLDYDFGSTPMLYQAGSCPAQFVAQNKDGTLYLYDQSSIASGAVQALEMANPTEAGEFIGVAAYSPAAGDLYVGDPAGCCSFASGLVALQVQADCTLALAWQMAEGSPAGDNDNVAATVANGVVYSVDGIGDEIYANDASSGAPLWNSASIVSGPVFAPPAVTAGHLYVGSWDDDLYSFGLQ